MAKRPGTFAGDDERIAAGRRHRTPAGGVPVEVDSELTPPPQLPPLPPPSDHGSNTARLDRLELATERLAEGVKQVWPARHDGEAFERYEHAQAAQAARIDRLIDGIAATHAVVDNFLMPAVKDMQGHLSTIAGEWPWMREAIEDIAPRLDKVEIRFASLAEKVDSLAAQFHGVSVTAAQLERRVTSVERDLADHRAQDVVKRVDALEKQRDATELVQKTNRWWLAKIIATASFLGGGIAYALSHLKEIAAYFGG